MNLSSLTLLSIAIWPTYAQDHVLPEASYVCDVLNNLPAYRNKLITIKGEWIRGEHGDVMKGQCTATLASDKHIWPNAISLEQTGLSRDQPTLTFRTDMESLRRAWATLARERLAGNAKPVTITVEGWLQSPEALLVTKTEPIRGNGFGHLSVYPARLLIRAVKSVTFDVGP